MHVDTFMTNIKYIFHNLPVKVSKPDVAKLFQPFYKWAESLNWGDFYNCYPRAGEQCHAVGMLNCLFK